jgi:hypothetical protein
MGGPLANLCSGGEGPVSDFKREVFFVVAGKSREDGDAYIGMRHKQLSGMTPPWLKRTVSGRKRPYSSLSMGTTSFSQYSHRVASTSIIFSQWGQ